MNGRVALAGRRVLAGIAVAALLVLAGAGVWSASRSASVSQADQVSAVTEDLRCPTCAGQSVAASRSDMAEQMRQVVGQQIGQGRTPDQVREWFTQRYGDGILLDPPWRGAGLAIQLLPLLVLAVGAVVLLAARHRPLRALLPRAAVVAAAVLVAAGAVATLRAGGGEQPMAATGAVQPAAQAGKQQAGEQQPRDAEGWVALGAQRDASGDVDGGLTAYRKAAALRPDDPVIAVRLGTALLRSGAAPQAQALVEPLLRRHQDDPDLLLVLGLAQREQGKPQASDTLRQFVAAAPDHPAADQVRTMLQKG